MTVILTVDQVAVLARMSKRTLQDWATDWEKNGIGRGPRPHRLEDRFTRYHLDEVAEWLRVEPGQLKVPA